MTDKNLMIPASMQKSALSTKFATTALTNDLAEGIKGGFGIIGYKGKVWSTKFQGNETALMREDGDGPRASIEVVIVRASKQISKIYYEAGFVDGSTAPPDCWSTNGVVPDGAAPKKQSTTCAGCPKNAWGSKITEAGKQTKACSDSKRLAVTPLSDPANELMGGPMLLRVPAASLKDLKTYGDELQSYGFPYFAVATRISFDHNEAFPKFVLSAIRPLTDAEADIVLAMRDGPQVSSMLNESVEIVHHEPEAAVPASPFEQAQPAQVATPAPQTPAAVQTPAVTPAAGAKPSEPRKRRTKAEMEAAAAALAASRNGGAPAAQAAQAPAVQPVQQAAQPAAEPSTAGIEDFDAKLDALLPG